MTPDEVPELQSAAARCSMCITSWVTSEGLSKALSAAIIKGVCPLSSATIALPQSRRSSSRTTDTLHNRKDYSLQCHVDEKPGVILGCPCTHPATCIHAAVPLDCQTLARAETDPKIQACQGC